MITPEMILKAKKRVKELVNVPVYKRLARCLSGDIRRQAKAALLAKILNDMEDEDYGI